MGSKPSIISQMIGWFQPSAGSWQQFKQPSQGFIELRNLSKCFTEGVTQRQVLSDLTMTFEQGQFIVLLGQSGSGKSTLLNLLSGIEQPTAGTVLIDAGIKRADQATSLPREGLP